MSRHVYSLFTGNCLMYVYYVLSVFLFDVQIHNIFLNRRTKRGREKLLY